MPAYLVTQFKITPFIDLSLWLYISDSVRALSAKGKKAKRVRARQGLPREKKRSNEAVKLSWVERITNLEVYEEEKTGERATEGRKPCGERGWPITGLTGQAVSPTEALQSPTTCRVERA